MAIKLEMIRHEKGNSNNVKFQFKIKKKSKEQEIEEIIDFKGKFMVTYYLY